MSAICVRCGMLSKSIATDGTCWECNAHHRQLRQAVRKQDDDIIDMREAIRRRDAEIAALREAVLWLNDNALSFPRIPDHVLARVIQSRRVLGMKP